MSLQGPTTKTTFLDRLLTGEDAEAWDEFVRVYAGPLLRLFRKLGANAHDAEALAQDVLSRVAVYIQQKKTFDRSKGTFRGFLYTCARNEYSGYASRLQKLPKTGGSDAALEAGARFAGGGPSGTVDHTRDLHFQWFVDETWNSGVRRVLDQARALFPEKTYRAFEITSVTVENLPEGAVYVVRGGRADSELVVSQAAAELGLDREQVWDEKLKVKEWVLERLRELLPEGP